MISLSRRLSRLELDQPPIPVVPIDPKILRLNLAFGLPLPLETPQSVRDELLQMFIALQNTMRSKKDEPEAIEVACCKLRDHIATIHEQYE